ncbi:hypothetical protein, partial [Methylorubrum sp. SB2]|uniref:hypothetical protein n=1 Tax=Methylorubrum subtropicum TaxID=3138812 RepID=UPI00313DA9F9
LLPASVPARMAASSSLLGATMNQPSSVREGPQSVSKVLTPDTQASPAALIVDQAIRRKFKANNSSMLLTLRN